MAKTTKTLAFRKAMMKAGVPEIEDEPRLAKLSRTSYQTGSDIKQLSISKGKAAEIHELLEKRRKKKMSAAEANAANAAELKAYYGKRHP